MRMIVTCVQCKVKINVPEVAVGQKARCPRCRADLPVATEPTAPQISLQREKLEPPRKTRRLGLALSGGGLRASFFHIGVLAQMARLGMLRHVEVISTVSGGSIVGACYYLLVKSLLQRKRDHEITDNDYCEVVKKLEREFFDAAQMNLRVRSLLNPWNIIRTCMPNYSRTDHLGELFDRYLFRPVLHGNQKNEKLMRDLRIKPDGAAKPFQLNNAQQLREHNEPRQAKVPVLLLNATTLNTGHNWQFSAERMGEPPLDCDQEIMEYGEIDKLPRLKRPERYEQLPKRLSNITLGLSVAASCCVPGLFPPMAVSDMYGIDIRVQLVDGGVHDNQGIDTLLEWKCTDFVISDASQQMREVYDPATQLLPVVNRSFDILGSQLRVQSLLRVLESDERRVALMHLRKGLSAEAISYVERKGQVAKATRERVPATSFGVPEATQKALSRLRTDLDAFSEVEAFSLMLDAYLMSETELRSLGEFVVPGPEPKWAFLKVKPWLTQSNPHGSRYLALLKLGQHRQFRLYMLHRRGLTACLTVALAVASVPAYLSISGDEIAAFLTLPIPLWVMPVVFGLLSLTVLPQLIAIDWFPAWLRKPFKPLHIAGRFMVTALAAPVVSACAALQLYVIGPLYQRAGKLDRLKPP